MTPKALRQIEEIRRLVNADKLSPDVGYLLVDSIFWRWFFLEHLKNKEE